MHGAADLCSELLNGYKIHYMIWYGDIQCISELLWGQLIADHVSILYN